MKNLSLSDCQVRSGRRPCSSSWCQRVSPSPSGWLTMKVSRFASSSAVKYLEKEY